jgi:hypothetical protein
MIEIQLAQRLARDTWRINRIQAVEENIFALGHSGPYANIKSAHPEIHAAMVQALTFRNDPKLLTYIAPYEQKLTRNFQINFNMLLKLQSLRSARAGQEKTPAPTAWLRFVKLASLGRAKASALSQWACGPRTMLEGAARSGPLFSDICIAPSTVPPGFCPAWSVIASGIFGSAAELQLGGRGLRGASARPELRRPEGRRRGGSPGPTRH